MVLSDLWGRMEAQYDALPPRLREAAAHVRGNPAEVALHGLRHTARAAGLSPGTLLRLVQTLGFPGWEEFQALHRDWLTDSNGAVYSGRADRTLGAAPAETLLERLAGTEQANALSGLRPEQRDRLHAAAALLAGAASIGVVGLRSCHPVAHALHYGLSLFHPGAALLGATGGLMLDQVYTLEPDAVLVAISVAPYSRETVAAARHARDTGLRVLALTDAPLGPVARLSDIALTAANDGPAHLASITGLVALAQALTGLTLARLGRPGLDALRRREAMLAARTAFLPPET